MGAINGQEFINRINSLKSEIWLDGEKIDGLLSEHHAFKGLISSKASLYNLQLEPNLKDDMTYISPTSGERIGLSYMQPKTIGDLQKRRGMMRKWAQHTNGVMGRSPDYLNSVIMSLFSSKAFLAGKKNCFPDHLQALYERAREQDLSFTHTFIPPQVNRSQLYIENSEEPIAAKIVEENEEGLIIKGARLLATQGGCTDEVFVSSGSRFHFEDEAFAFSIPSNTKGLRFICRESFVGGESTFNHPLSSRYEEMDSIVVFDRVLVPWERVLYYKNVEVAENLLAQSSFHHFATHQVITRQIVKTEFILGLTELLIGTINVREYPHIQDKMAEIIIGLETMKALLEKSENNASVDKWGTLCPDIVPLRVASNISPKIFPRFSEIIQLISASGIISIPTENAFQSEVRPDLEQYLQAASKPAEDRVKIFRLAWDLTMSAFGTRQTQYERFFFGDPNRLSCDLYKTYPKQEYVQRVNDFLDL
ncbi:4-hydroxyphenylacetate 3-monooxygenase, oxygenase component [Lysinibacillus sp. 54212]|uniref:4-hydroxyphenylacetate 3-monooxygenase, oxygenase component n=1 Tax=Lysinibacillus sp. 54212 TaxID=3119829 RepID=UPI002FC6FFD9